jgi:hypothetical protein
MLPGDVGNLSGSLLLDGIAARLSLRSGTGLIGVEAFVDLAEPVFVIRFELRHRLAMRHLPLNDGGRQRLGLWISAGSEFGRDGTFGRSSFDDGALQRLEVLNEFALCNGLAQGFSRWRLLVKCRTDWIFVLRNGSLYRKSPV